ncbi:MAG: 30S ribosomal protein S7 [Gammaproteobacteria bacterium]
MSRRRAPQIRSILPDPKYGDGTLAKFINNLMYRGKKSLAQKIVYDALDIIGDRTKREPLEVFLEALEHVGPMVEVKSRRIGGATYQIPVPVRPARKSALAMRWLVTAARKRREKSMTSRLANELLEASNGAGTSVRKREEVHKMAEANKAFAHFRY